jgi:16S rRNA (uracil1498-N3)-methyltransferase
MPYFLSDKKLVLNQPVEIEGEEARHILLSHRAKAGDRVVMQDIEGGRFEVEVVSPAKKKLTVKPLKSVAVPKEPDKSLVLFQSWVSEKVLDLILQKSVELGVTEVVLFNSQNTATKMAREKFELKIKRWQKLMWEAAKQCGRGKIPQLGYSTDVESLEPKLEQLDRIFLADIEGKEFKEVILLANQTGALGCIVGPEGGFSQEELIRLKNHAAIVPVRLSQYTLRAETAALAALSLLSVLK